MIRWIGKWCRPTSLTYPTSHFGRQFERF
uniref:Uncharacterized protein n=1 Tax=Anguilla anguilla TaxID=7936 RepID=A0A0E9U0H6_ANGAN